MIAVAIRPGQIRSSQAGAHATYLDVDGCRWLFGLDATQAESRYIMGDRPSHRYEVTRRSAIILRCCYRTSGTTIADLREMNAQWASRTNSDRAICRISVNLSSRISARNSRSLER